MRTIAPKPQIVILVLLMLTICLPIGSARADALPERAYVEGVKGRRQSYSLSCEARSAVDWAAFHGVRIGEKKFQSSLPRSKNPDEGFVGNPNDPWGNIPPASYGVHAEPVAALLREFGLEALARRDLRWDDLRAEISAGRPVIVWVIGQMWDGTPVQYKAAGAKTNVARYEHTMLLVGYNPKQVQVIDAYSGQTQVYPLRAFMNSWSVLGRMAILGSGLGGGKPEETHEPSDEPDETSPMFYLPLVFRLDSWEGVMDEAEEDEPAGPRTYIVRKGDYLMTVAGRFGVSWRKLASFNGIDFPYVIYAGQVLKIP